MTVPLMVDLSSNNGAPDLSAHFGAGYRVLALKATEGTGYTWRDHGTHATTWHRLGGRVVHYHFAQAGNPIAQADYFADAIRATFDKRRDFVCLDAERGGVNGAFARQFIDRVVKQLGSVNGLIYGSPSFLNGYGVTKYRGWRLWLAEYGPRADVPKSWDTWHAWQFTDRATHVAGIPGAVDQSHVKSWLLPATRPVIAYPTLRLGSRGAWVRKLQTLLNARSRAGLTVDGAFGPATRKALNAYKAQHRWKADGICGYRVWRALTKAP